MLEGMNVMRLSRLLIFQIEWRALGKTTYINLWLQIASLFHFIMS